MVINVQKVAVILALNGTSRRQAMRVFTKKIKDHRYLRISCSGEGLLLPIHRHSPYLGAVTSYQNFAELSLQLRLQKCKAAHARLRGVLQGRRGLSLGQRILLWKTTVLPCAMYGLGACGLTSIQLVRLRQVLLKQLRAISRTPAHITHESDAALLSRLGVLAPQQSTCSSTCQDAKVPRPSRRARHAAGSPMDDVLGYRLVCLSTGWRRPRGDGAD